MTTKLLYDDLMADPEVARHNEDLDIAAWCQSVLEGPSGMRAFEDREIVIWHIPERNAVAHWIIRCLANPDCDGANEVIGSILERRRSVLAKRGAA